MKAKKSYGQHFLINQSLVQSIVDYIEDFREELPLLEIGPGRGALTEHLIYTPGFIAIEADRDMKAHLDSQYPSKSAQIIQEDFLKWPLRQNLGTPYCLVGNFPYNISTQIVFRLLEHLDLFPAMVGMFQKEVADRIRSAPDSKVYGIQSVLVQHYYDTALVVRVSPGSFSPPPKVHSAVISLRRKEDYEDHTYYYPELRRLVKISFNHRRKMLRTSLKSLNISDLLSDLKLGELRPAQLDLDTFRHLAKAYHALMESKKSSKSS